jgi:hypothetical protein
LVSIRSKSCLQRVSAADGGYQGVMDLSLLLMVIGIIVAVLLHEGLGIAMILIGLVLLLWPRLRRIA